MLSPFRSMVRAVWHVLPRMYIHRYTWTHIYGISASVLPSLAPPLKFSFKETAQIQKDYIYVPVYACLLL